MSNENTQDLSKFGYIELHEAGRLLSAFKDKQHDKTRFLSSDGVAVEFNTNSGNVFLVDSNYNVAMMNGDDLEDFFSCPQCGYEGFGEDMQHNEDNKDCQEYLKSISNA
jgi:hypothetical protein